MVPGRIKIAIVGCGAIAEAIHVPAALAVNTVDLVALVDSDLGRARCLAGQFGIARTAGTVGELVDAVDAVMLATPPHIRPALAQQAFEHGLHVLCEKPMANTVAECDAIIEASRRAERVLGVAHVYRFRPSRMAIKELIDGGSLGQVHSVAVSQGKPYTWEAASGYTVRREMVPGGVLINAGIHPLDTLLWWFGEPADFDYEDDALGGLESNVRMALRFNSGIVARLRQSRTCNLPHEIRVEADNGTVVLPTYSTSEYELLRDGCREARRCAGESYGAAQCEQAQLRDFAESITMGRSPRVGGEEGKRVIELIERCYKAKRARPLPNRVPQPGATW